MRVNALLDNLERGLLPVPRGRTGEQSANRLNRLTVPANDATDVALSHLQFKNRQLSGRNFRKHDFIGKLNELSNNELKEFLHRACDHSLGAAAAVVVVAAGADRGVVAAPASATPATGARFLFFLIKLRTVSDAWAPRAIQYSARSNFNALLSPGFFGS
jgi:hypothetical protein